MSKRAYVQTLTPGLLTFLGVPAGVVLVGQGAAETVLDVPAGSEPATDSAMAAMGFAPLGDTTRPAGVVVSDSAGSRWRVWCDGAGGLLTELVP